MPPPTRSRKSQRPGPSDNSPQARQVRQLRAYPGIGAYGKGLLARSTNLPYNCGVYKKDSLNERRFIEGWYDY